MSDPDENSNEPLGYRRPPVKWVTVRTFGQSASAHLARLRLESLGIPCAILDENMGTIYWHALPAIGGIKLRVPIDQLEAARSALENPDREDEDIDPDEPDEADQEQYDGGEDLPVARVTICPKCLSDDAIEFTWSYRILQASAILLLASFLQLIEPMLIVLLMAYAVYFLIVKPQYRCLSCRHRWSDAQ